MFLQRPIVRRLLQAVDRGVGTDSMAHLFLASYLFLLRVPSEALPMRRGDSCMQHDTAWQSVLYLEDDATVCLRLRSRKNRPGGSILRRRCACSSEECSGLCPVHGLWMMFFAHLPVGTQPWAGTSGASALSCLRRCLADLSVHPAAFGIRCEVLFRVG